MFPRRGEIQYCKCYELKCSLILLGEILVKIILVCFFCFFFNFKREMRYRKFPAKNWKGENITLSIKGIKLVCF